MHLHARAIAFALAASVGFFAVGCKKKSSPLAPKEIKAPAFFLEAAATQDQRVALVVIPSVGGTIEKLGAIAGKLQLPTDAAALRSLVVGPLGLPEVAWTHIDETKPMGLAMMAGKENRPSPTALAAQARSNKDAEALVGALGQKVETRDGAFRVKRPDESEVWLYVDGDDVVASDTFEGLKVGGAHALGARTKVNEDVLATVYPEAIAKANGTTVRQYVTDLRTKALETLREQSATTPSPMPFEATEQMLAAFIDPYLDDLSDMAAADVALIINDKDGLVLRSRAHPKADSAFARRLAKVTPYKVAPALLEEASPVALFAATYSEEALHRYANAMAGLAQMDLPGMAAIASGTQAALAQMGTSYSGQASFGDALTYSFVGDLKEGADPLALMDGLELAFGPKGMGLLMKHGAPAAKGRAKGQAGVPAVVWKRQGLTARLEMPLVGATGDKKVQAQMQQLFGGNRLTYTFAIANGKFFGLMHPRPEAELARLTEGKEPAPAPAVQAALAATEGSEAFGYFDVLGFVRPFIRSGAKVDPAMGQANAMMGMLPGLATMSLPVLFSYKGGEAMTAQLALPMATLTNVAELARPLMGMMMGAAARGGAATP